MRQGTMWRSCAAGLFVAVCSLACAKAPAQTNAPAVVPNLPATNSTDAPSAAPATSSPAPANNAVPALATQPEQTPTGPPAPPTSQTSQSVVGGKLHGTVKSGNIPLPGRHRNRAKHAHQASDSSTTTDVSFGRVGVRYSAENGRTTSFAPSSLLSRKVRRKVS